MSGPAYVVMPVQADDAQHSEPDTAKIASAIQQSLYEKTHPEDHDGQGDIESLKEIIAFTSISVPDCSYWLQWEDPIRTLGSYIGALSILFGAHYLPITQLALKAGAVTFGVMSVTEFASRSFGPDTFLSRLRPKEYRKIPESTLNATLKDIHDFVQYAVVQIQRITFAQDLDRTFADGKAKAADLSSKAQETAEGMRRHIGDLAQSGKQTAANLPSQARNTASDVSGATAENLRRLPEKGTNVINKAPGIIKSALSDAQQQ
ncbi:hypothetical protein NW754_000339 [Fusarium falciforme]|nr:hypothetical protein NW754_000339 [Fusarium falciforme]